jgi:hypothetical protein
MSEINIGGSNWVNASVPDAKITVPTKEEIFGKDSGVHELTISDMQSENNDVEHETADKCLSLWWDFKKAWNE